MMTYRIAASVSLIAAACVFVPGTAGAEPYQPPELAFAAQGADSIVATITNPNASGLCWAVIDLDGSVHEFTEHDPAGSAGPGSTVRPVRSGLAPGRYRLSGFCGTSHTSPGQVRGADYFVEVPAAMPSTGSFGS
ncbi:hypothetical protein ACFC06_00845 [Nocardia sp. NPDC056064]|uniref:hypothetical protein n=1 Tax=Nocardia sp. NPDC056064 TaxID=3345701 RepID=UPI0035E25CFF